MTDQLLSPDAERVLGMNCRHFEASYSLDSLPIGPLMQGCIDNGEAELDNGVVIREIRRRVE